MAHYTEQTGFPAVPITEGTTLRIRALSPTTDAEISGVTVAQWAIYARDKAPEAEEIEDPINPVEWIEVPYTGAT